MTPLRGAVAAAVTPLRDGGATLDDAAFPPLYQFYADAGLDGVMTLGTTGEGILLAREERIRAADLSLDAAAGLIPVIVHAGAQTTADTVALAAHAAEAGATAVSVIGPPYFALDDEELFAHFAAAAAACAPLPFYVYEFAARTGYAVAPALLERLRDSADNLAGLKVSDQPWERFSPYLIDGLAIFVGPENLIAQGLAAGAVGAVSGLAAGFPELVVEAIRTGSAQATQRAAELRELVSRFPFQSALKAALARRGVPVQSAVRGPLRPLERAEAESLHAQLDSWFDTSGDQETPNSASAHVPSAT